MLENFFGYTIDPDNGVRLFTWHHYMLVGFALLAIYLPLKFGKKLANQGNDSKFRNFLFLWLLGLEIIYHAHNWIWQEWSFPLHICSFAVIMCLALLKTNSQRIFEYVFFFGVLGGFMALFIPINYGFPYYNIRYYHFILIHTTIIFIPLYYYRAYGFRVTLRATYKTFFMVLLIMPIIYNLNRIIQRFNPDIYSNYWFVSEIPDHVGAVFSNHLLYMAGLISLVYTSQMLLYKISNRNISGNEDTNKG